MSYSVFAPQVTRFKNLEQLREITLNRLLIFGSILGTPLYIFALIAALQSKLFVAALTHTVVYFGLVAITFFQKIPLTIRTHSLLAFLLFLGIQNLYYNGFNVDSGLFLLTLVCMQTLLSGTKVSLATIAFALIIISVAAFFIVAQGHVPKQALPQNNPLLWIIGGIIFLLMGTLVTFTLSTLLNGLSFNLGETTRLAKELEQEHNALLRSEKRYRHLVEASPDAILLLGQDKHITSINPAGVRLFGHQAADEFTGQEIVHFFPKKNRQALLNGFTKASNVGILRELELPITGATDAPSFVSLSAAFMPDEEDSAQAYIVVLSDISSLKRAEHLLEETLNEVEQKVIERTEELRQSNQHLLESEIKYRTLAESSQDIIFILGPDFSLEYINQFGVDFMQYSREKLLGNSILGFIPKEQRSRFRRNVNIVSQTGKKVRGEDRFKLGGSDKWLDIILVPFNLRADDTYSVLGISRDITELKQVETSLLKNKLQLEERVTARTAELNASQVQLRQLTQQLITSDEEQKRKISRELHDSVGQVLLTIKHSLVVALESLPAQEDMLRPRLDRNLRQVEECARMIRSVSHQLRPPMLELGGIHLGLEELCEETHQNTGLEIHYEGQDIPDLSDEIAISLYRVAQEAIANILKHAKASKAQVALQYGRNLIRLEISDNGIGNGQSSQSGIGLVGLKERLQLLNGSLKEEESPKGGFCLTALVPWSAKTDNLQTSFST